VKVRYPGVVFIVSTPTIAALTDRETTTRLARIADSAKSEYRHAVGPRFDKRVFKKNRGVLAEPPAHLRQAVGWTVLRDAADGRPPHIWAGGVPDVNHARAFAASLLTFGCVAAMDVWEASLLGGQDQPPGKTPLKGVKAAFALGGTVSPHLARSRLLRWAAVHFGERSRNARGGDYLAAWQQVLWPLVGTFKVLAQAGLPVGIVDDDHLEYGGLDGYRLLVLPNPGELTGAQRQAVAAFAAAGGIVIENDPAWPWSAPAGTDAAAAALRAALEPHVASAPVSVIGHPASGYAVSYRHRNRLIVAVTNDFSWVQIQTVNKPVPRDKINPPAPRARGVQVTWRKGHGLPERKGTHSQGRRLRAIDAVSGASLAVEALDGGYRVTLPTFRFMALLVVTATR
jgi:hypothetical protein